MSHFFEAICGKKNHDALKKKVENKKQALPQTSVWVTTLFSLRYMLQAPLFTILLVMFEICMQCEKYKAP